MSSDAPPSPSPGMEKPEFFRVCGRFATGVTIATVLDPEGGPHGITVNSFTSVSYVPPLILICIGHKASVLAHFRTASHFGINVLRREQQALSELFARKTHDRFLGVPWYAGTTGAPLLYHVLATFECAVHKNIPAGDHDIVIGRVLHTRAHGGDPLVYFASAYRQLE